MPRAVRVAGWLAVPLIGLSIWLLVSPRVHVTHFSPDLLLFRSRTYCYFGLIPLGEDTWSTSLLRAVADMDLVPASSGPSRWFFVYGDKPGVRGWIGEAKPAYRLFRDETWLQWTRDNPEGSKPTWKRILKSLRDEDFEKVDEIRISEPPEVPAKRSPMD